MPTKKTQIVKFIRKGDKGASVIVAETTPRKYTYAQWKVYGTVGHLETWANINNAAAYSVGDTIVINGICTDRANKAVSLYATVQSVSGTSITASTTSIIMDGDKGEPGDAGSRGPAFRGPMAWSDTAEGFKFMCGAVGEKYSDVVIYKDQYYSCIKSHVKTAKNYPGSTEANNNKLWQLGDRTEFVATKIMMAAYALVKNLGVEAIEMKDAEGNILFQAKDGNVTCKTGTFENVTIQGTLKGVSGSFHSLDCLDSSGNVVGRISFDESGRLWFEGDLYHQGYNSEKKRSYRFYTSNLWCRGQFGAASRCVLLVKGSYGYYYPNGVKEAGTYVSLSYANDNRGNRYYRVPMYGLSGDYAGMPVDELVFCIEQNTAFNYKLSLNDSQRALVVNAYNLSNNVNIYANGNMVTWNGGEVAEVVQLASILRPAVDSNKLGAGLIIGAFRDNNW